MADKLTQYKGVIGGNQTVSFGIARSRSYLIRELVSATGINVDAWFKIGNDGEMPANFVQLAAGNGTFIGSGFDRFEISNPTVNDISYLIIVSPDIISDSSVTGTVSVKNAKIPKVNITDPDIMVPLYVQDYKSQDTGNFFSISPVYPVIANFDDTNSLHVLINESSVTAGQVFNLFVCNGNQYVKRITVQNEAKYFELTVGAITVVEKASYQLELNGDMFAYNSGFEIGGFLRDKDIISLKAINPLLGKTLVTIERL